MKTIPFAFIFCSLLICCLFACGTDEDREFLAPSEAAVPPTPAAAASSTTESTPVATRTPTAAPTSSNVSSARISSFIWKPESERDGNLVVLVNPTNIRIVVTGAISETLRNSGPSNGKGTTGRSSFSGCDFGTNASVEFFDSFGRRVLTRGGRRSISIPRGCDRFEF